MRDLMRAIAPLAWDFLPTIAFAALAALHVDVRLSTALAVGVGLVQVLIIKAMKREVGVLQWAGLGLAVVFGAVSMATNDPRFVMVKPSIIYLAIAIVMLKPGWMLRYVPKEAHDYGADLIVAWGYAWAGLLGLTAVLNLVVAAWFTKQWPLFVAVWPLWSKLSLFGIQYVSMRLIITRRVTSALAQPA